MTSHFSAVSWANINDDLNYMKTIAPKCAISPRWLLRVGSSSLIDSKLLLFSCCSSMIYCCADISTEVVKCRGFRKTTSKWQHPNTGYAIYNTELIHPPRHPTMLWRCLHRIYLRGAVNPHQPSASATFRHSSFCHHYLCHSKFATCYILRLHISPPEFRHPQFCHPILWPSYIYMFVLLQYVVPKKASLCVSGNFLLQCPFLYILCYF